MRTNHTSTSTQRTCNALRRAYPLWQSTNRAHSYADTLRAGGRRQTICAAEERSPTRAGGMTARAGVVTSPRALTRTGILQCIGAGSSTAPPRVAVPPSGGVCRYRPSIS
eukprot:scaffold23523_cov31-Prasinocladus_malaysianus.AAC.2